MISPWTIYWLGVLESLQNTIFMILLVILFVMNFIPSKETVKKIYLIDNPTSKMTLEVLEAVKE